jgi:hypothetical protein
MQYVLCVSKLLDTLPLQVDFQECISRIQQGGSLLDYRVDKEKKKKKKERTHCFLSERLKVAYPSRMKLALRTLDLAVGQGR